jgi:hypothetical protein
MKVQFPVSNLVNRLVLSCSVHLVIYLGLVRLAIDSAQGMVWMRCATAVTAFLPVHFWLVNEGIASDLRELRASRKWGAIAFFIFAFGLSVIPFTDSFISTAPAAPRHYGLGYFIYMAGVLAMYLALALDGFRRIKALSGGRRFALQVWLSGGCAAFALALSLMVLGIVTRDPHLVRAQPFVVLACFAWTAFAVTANRTFDGRQFLRVGVEKAILVAVLAMAAGLVYVPLERVVPATVAWVVTIVLTWGFAVVINSRWDRMFRLFPQEGTPLPGPTA